MADQKISTMTSAGTLTGTEELEVVQSGSTRKTTTQAVANLTPPATDHGVLTGLADDDHTQYHTDARGDARYPPQTLNIIAGNGLTGGGTLAADRTLNVGAGTGILVTADAVGLDTENVRNIPHTSVSINAVSGLEGGGDLTTSRSVGIADNGVTLAKLVDIATATFLGRVTAATGDPEVLTATQATSLINAFTSALKGAVPASGGGTTNFLRADGTWASPPGSGVTAHGSLTGLSDDDHLQYLNNTRGDARYYTQGQMNAGQMDTRYYTEAEAVALFAAIVHNHPSTEINDSSAAGRAMLTATNVAAQTALLNQFTSALKGMVPSSGGGTANYLRADGTWASPPGTTTGNHSALTGLANDDHTQYHNDARGDARYPPNTRSVLAGTGLTGGGNLAADRTLTLDTASVRNVDHSAVQISAGSGLTGGGTIEATRTLAIADNGVTLAKLVDISQNRLLGRISAGVGDPQELTVGQVTALLSQFTSTDQGLAPGSGGGTAAFLRADGTWNTPPGTGVPTTRSIATSAPLTGGGNLSADRTLGISNFSSGAAGAVPASGGGTANFLRADGSWAAPPASSLILCDRSAFSAQTLLENDVTLVQFDANNIDQGGWVAAGTADDRIYVPGTGNKYVRIQVRVTVDFSGGDTSGVMLVLSLRQNTAIISQVFMQAPYLNASTPYATISLSHVYYTTAGSYFDATVLADRVTGTENLAIRATNRGTTFSCQVIG